MEVIKKKITLDSLISRDKSNWGKVTGTTFNINVFFTQDGDDMGISTEVPFIERSTTPVDYSLLITKLAPILSGYMFGFMTGGTTNFPLSNKYPSIRYPGKTISQYFINGIPVTGLTEDRLDVVTSYDANDKYKPGFDIESTSGATDYKDVVFSAGTRVITNSALNPITYLIDGDIDPAELALLPTTKRGVYYTTSTGTSRTIVSSKLSGYYIPTTEMYYNSEGFNKTNIHLSADTKENYLFGITSTPTVFSDLVIERGRTSVIQSHMQLSEIRNMAELINYGNGFYNLRKY